MEVYVLLKDILDFESESRRLQKELSKLEKEFSLTQKKLSNEDFLGQAPQDVIEKEREKGAGWERNWRSSVVTTSDSKH